MATVMEHGRQVPSVPMLGAARISRRRAARTTMQLPRGASAQQGQCALRGAVWHGRRGHGSNIPLDLPTGWANSILTGSAMEAVCDPFRPSGTTRTVDYPGNRYQLTNGKGYYHGSKRHRH